MSNFLIRQRRDGVPVGIHTADAYFYTQEGKRFQGDGVSVVSDRPKDETWDEYVNEKSHKAPDHNGKWMQYDSNAGSLPDALSEARTALGV